MNAIDQAFVKAYARRQHASSHPHSKPEAGAAMDDGVVVDRSVADSASVWIDHGNQGALRIDAAHSPAQQPAPPAVARSKGANQPASAKSPSPPATVTNAAHSPTDATLQHIHTAYAIVEGDSSWIDVISSESVVRPTIETRDTPAHVDEIIQTERKPLGPNRELFSRLDDATNAIEAPHIRRTQNHSASEPEPVAPEPMPAPELIQPPRPQAKTVDDAATVHLGAQLKNFHAKWEIDALDVPTAVGELFFDGELFQQVAQQLAEAAETGLRRVLVTSVHDGEGRSTVAIGLAIAAAAAGKRVALIDADTTSPTLVDDLRLDLEFGWIEAIRARLSLEEVCVHATQDGVTLVPLLTPHGATAATARETRELIEKLDPNFDLLIVDGGSSQCATTIGTLGDYDSAMIVFNKTRTATADINEYSFQLRCRGVSGVGVVENFVS